MLNCKYTKKNKYRRKIFFPSGKHIATPLLSLYMYIQQSRPILTYSICFLFCTESVKYIIKRRARQSTIGMAGQDRIWHNVVGFDKYIECVPLGVL